MYACGRGGMWRYVEVCGYEIINACEHVDVWMRTSGLVTSEVLHYKEGRSQSRRRKETQGE